MNHLVQHGLQVEAIRVRDALEEGDKTVVDKAAVGGITCKAPRHLNVCAGGAAGMCAGGLLAVKLESSSTHPAAATCRSARWQGTQAPGALAAAGRMPPP